MTTNLATPSATQPSVQPSVSRAGVLIFDPRGQSAHVLEGMLRELGYHTCPIARDEDEVLQTAHAEAPDLVLVDTDLDALASGLHVARRLYREVGQRVVYVSSHADPAMVERANETLPYGYLLKPIRLHDLRCCLALALHRARLTRADKVVLPPRMQALSVREVEVLRLIARGHTSKDIAQTLRIAKPTVETYRQRLTEKLGVKGRTELVSIAADAGLMTSAPLRTGRERA